jgi:nucleoside phosphorylase
LPWGDQFVLLPERSLYLYFLDRELGDAAGYSLSPEVARHVARTLVISTNSRLICGISLLYENTNLDYRTVEFFGEMIAAGSLDVVSHHLSNAEFMASRVAMYQHDAQRYPAYFGLSRLPDIEPTVLKTGGTTAHIVAGMTEWALSLPSVDPRYKITVSQLRSPVMRAIGDRDERALTFSLFRPYLGELADLPAARAGIRRAISRLYATDYRDFGDNDVPTGIRGLVVFERELARDFPLYDVQILADILRLCGIYSAYADAEQPSRIWESLLLARSSESHALLAATVRWIVSSLADLVIDQWGIDRHDEVRFQIMGLLHRLTTPQRIPATPVFGADLYAAAADNASFLARQLKRDSRLSETMVRLQGDFLPPPRADVLLVVATEVESEMVIEVFTENGHSLENQVFSTTNAYHMFAPIGGARIALTRCSMGAGGPGGPELTVAEAIGALRPTSVIMVGIAFGVNRREQRIGDVLLSTHVFDYDLERVGTDSKGSLARLSRGARPEASARLLSRFRMARLPPTGLWVREGIMLSGKKLIDNVDYRDSLRSICPEAIGGEMEGGGIYAAAARSNVDWIIVKAICDWADGAKQVQMSHRQRLAARNAALAVLRTLERGGFAG